MATVQFWSGTPVSRWTSVSIPMSGFMVSCHVLSPVQFEWADTARISSLANSGRVRARTITPDSTATTIRIGFLDISPSSQAARALPPGRAMIPACARYARARHERTGGHRGRYGRRGVRACPPLGGRRHPGRDRLPGPGEGSGRGGGGELAPRGPERGDGGGHLERRGRRGVRRGGGDGPLRRPV